IEILGLKVDALQRCLASMTPPDTTIFISRNAVEFGFAYAEGKFAAIGPTTAEAIRQAGGTVEIMPASGFDSEHLLQESAFQNVAGKTIRIIRGQGGRDYLGEQLSQRGANVEYLATYERKLPVYTDDQLGALEKQWRAGDVDAVVVLSVQTFTNLQTLLPEWCQAELASTLLVTHSTRVLKEVLNQYPDCPTRLAGGPQAADIVECLVDGLRAG
ncbi:MAG: uroporphyrinogen-III synthase, partial [Gammaproteobacteria bacterium]|nr:uroporphyrinogen-III synthase [Gammaproteobacteria bacterium]